MSTFITQPKINLDEYPTDEIGELEALVSGVTQTSQSTLLLKKRKEMREVDDALEFMKEEFASRMRACEERQREFERKQNDMKEQVTRFEKFIQENDAKRQRAVMKAKAEDKQAEQNNAKIKQLRVQLLNDEGQKETKERELDSLRKYKDYLDGTVEASEEEYEEISDVLNRHKTLEDANGDLQVLVSRGETLMDKKRMELLALNRETQNQILVHNSEIHGYQKVVEGLRSEALQQDFNRESLEAKTNNRTRVLGQVEMSIKNLYTRCVATMRSKVPALKEKERKEYLQLCLRLIQERIVDLNDIAEKFETHHSHHS
jgi:hypothetical protein